MRLEVTQAKLEGERAYRTREDELLEYIKEMEAN
jgi:hypothetical protein